MRMRNVCAGAIGRATSSDLDQARIWRCNRFNFALPGTLAPQSSPQSAPQSSPQSAPQSSPHTVRRHHMLTSKPAIADTALAPTLSRKRRINGTLKPSARRRPLAHGANISAFISSPIGPYTIHGEITISLSFVAQARGRRGGKGATSYSRANGRENNAQECAQRSGGVRQARSNRSSLSVLATHLRTHVF